MLTIREPLNLKSIKPICSTMNPFSEKIRNNYDLFQVKFEEEDLLHLVTQPPEIYLGEGSMTSLVQDTRISHTQNVKMEMMNNLVNRIMLMNEQDFTYQDTVFVENILQKSGISEVSVFLKQVQHLQEDTRQTNQLIDLYWNHFQTLQEVINEVKTNQEMKAGGADKDIEKTPREHTKENSYYLHDAIFKRLQTGVIYQELKNYFTGFPGQEQQVQQRELLISENIRQSQNMILNKLQNMVQDEEQPVMYHRYNLYEESNPTIENQKHSTATYNLTSAVMLNLLDNIYEITCENLEHKVKNWYDVTHALQYAANNTLKRYEEFRTDHEYLNIRNTDYMTYMNQAKKNEYTTLNKILQISEQVTHDEWNTITDNYQKNSRLEQQGAVENIVQQHEITYENQENQYSNKFYQQSNGNLEQQIRQYQNFVNATEGGALSGNQEFRPVDTQFTGMEEQEEETVFHESEIPVENARMQDVPREYNEINPTELSTHNEYRQENQEDITVLKKLLERTENRYQTQIEGNQQEYRSEITLENEIHQNNREENLEQIQYENQTLQEQENHISNNQESRNYTTIRQQLDMINQQNLEKLQQLQLQEISTPKNIQINMERSRQDALRALTDPEGVLMEYRTHEEHQTERVEEHQKNQLEKLMSAETKEIYHLVEEYQKNPVRAIAESMVRIPTPEQFRNEIVRNVPESVPMEYFQDQTSPSAEPERILMEHHTREDYETQRVEERNRSELKAQVSEETREIYHMVEEYQKNPDRTIVENSIENPILKQFQRDISRTVQEAATMEHLQGEVEEQIVDRIVERYREPEEILRQSEIRRDEQIQNMEFVHKQVENVLSEEVLEELQQQNQILQRRTEVQREETVENTTVTKNNVTTNHIVEQATQDVTNLVREGLQKNINSISEQVYNRLEKKLVNERKRRGY
ncbi:MAG: hypothetical protein PHE02_12085 [Lachnospiraceae bacterium]|nr:hypothetical protein [Lachnospiraceae bacterium]